MPRWELRLTLPSPSSRLTFTLSHNQDGTAFVLRMRDAAYGDGVPSRLPIDYRY